VITTPKDPEKPRFDALVQRLGSLIRSGTLSIGASMLPGFVNYAIVIFLIYRNSAADAGAYRFVFSIFSLVAIFTLLEASKVMVRAVVDGEGDTISKLVATRIVAALTVFVISALVVLTATLGLGFSLSTFGGWPGLVAAGLALIYCVTDLYAPYLQANRQFKRFFLYALLKYGTSLAVFVGLVLADVPVVIAILFQLGVMTGFHIFYFFRTVAPDIAGEKLNLNPVRLFRGPAPRETAVLSMANALPASLEHVDKLVIGAIFGLEALGVYTLGFTTGRFIYNTLKPAIYVFYKQFVDKLPSVRLMVYLGIVMTLIGLGCAALFYWAIDTFPLLSRFKGTELVTAIVFAAYGVAMVDAVYTQAYAINRDTRSFDLLVANVFAGSAGLLLFVVAAAMPLQIALILFAAHYGIRHALTLLFLALRRRQHLRESQ
jgi:hypothetical protein